MIHGMIARPAAAMPTAPAVQRETVGGAVMSILAILTVLAVAALIVLRGRLRLAAGDE